MAEVAEALIDVPKAVSDRESATRRHYNRRFTAGRYSVSPQPKPVFVRQLKPDVIRRLTAHNALDPRFQPTNMHMLRWAIGQGSGLPVLARTRDQVRSATLPPLSDDEAALTDLIVQRSRLWVKRFVFLWYRTDDSVEEIAEFLSLSRSGVYETWRLALAHLDGRLIENGIAVTVVL